MTDLKGAGVQLVTNLMAAELLARGYRVDYVVDYRVGAALKEVPAPVRIFEGLRGTKLGGRLLLLRHCPREAVRLLYPALLGRRPTLALRQLTSLTAYLAKYQPDVLITTTVDRSLQAIWAARIAGVATRVIPTLRNPLSEVRADQESRAKNAHYWRRRWAIIRDVYPQAHAVVVVSKAMGADLVATTGLDATAVTTIYNPAVADNAQELAAETFKHPWVDRGQPPLIVAAGRLVPQKDFAGLINAFYRVRKNRRAHLMILGEGKLRPTLEAQIKELSLAGDIELPGWCDNPYVLMSRAQCFVLSSISEGLPGCLLQAMATGTPLVATDCPTGPREILDGGRFGRLVAVRDSQALAEAIAATLDNPPDTAAGVASSRNYTVTAIMDQYENLFGANVCTSG